MKHGRKNIKPHTKLLKFACQHTIQNFSGSWFQHAMRKLKFGIHYDSSFERVEEFIYLVTISTNQNSIQEQIKSRLKSGNACYHLVQNILSSSLLFKNLKIKMYITIVLPVFLM